MEMLQIGLVKWAKKTIDSQNGQKKELIHKLGSLLEKERDNEVLKDLIDTKIRLNWEIKNNEAYWE